MSPYFAWLLAYSWSNVPRCPSPGVLSPRRGVVLARDARRHRHVGRRPGHAGVARPCRDRVAREVAALQGALGVRLDRGARLDHRARPDDHELRVAEHLRVRQDIRLPQQLQVPWLRRPCCGRRRLGDGCRRHLVDPFELQGAGRGAPPCPVAPGELHARALARVVRGGPGRLPCVRRRLRRLGLRRRRRMPARARRRRLVVRPDGRPGLTLHGLRPSGWLRSVCPGLRGRLWRRRLGRRAGPVPGDARRRRRGWPVRYGCGRADGLVPPGCGPVPRPLPGRAFAPPGVLVRGTRDERRTAD